MGLDTRGPVIYPQSIKHIGDEFGRGGISGAAFFTQGPSICEEHIGCAREDCCAESPQAPKSSRSSRRPGLKIFNFRRLFMGRRGGSSLAAMQTSKSAHAKSFRRPLFLRAAPPIILSWGPIVSLSSSTSFHHGEKRPVVFLSSSISSIR